MLHGFKKKSKKKKFFFLPGDPFFSLAVFEEMSSYCHSPVVIGGSGFILKKL